MHLSTFSLLALSAALANAKTDLDGCTRTDISSPAGASYAWIVPGTGELCDPLDCGGGRAPPKTTVPGCAAYVGTETYSPSYLAGFTAPATAAASASAVVTSAEMTAAASATATPTAGASDDNSDDEDDSSDDEDPLGLAGIDAAQESTYVWRTADNPTATFNPFTASAFPSDVSTFWIPVDLGSTTSWEAAVPTILSGGYTDIVPASMPASSDLPAICAIATNSGCGVDMSTMTISRSQTSVTESSTPVGTASTSSMSRSWVKTIPTFTRVAANDAMVRAGVSGQSSTSSTASGSGSASRSASASTETSTDAAGKMGCAVGGVLAAAMGVLVVM
ncbi:hypothetical protein D6D21_08555 [Aureobasidium pullulans]|uniref:Concanavalin A-like lectin/glucanase n=1 Tax=Aureobasidium pullulans TaxID=5580 RepID=A0AB74IMR3_AURPU|nr:hypothetical protein D6D21_08555 [Aureobasidium pullulans]THX29191.1 hypothetical protein D6D11_10094 [Aureobasidium pullulans]THX29426.1 hypothetical protein D6D12_04170 [Aureobasidium pullulans]THX76830.1 hypothetical protein D6D08_05221 [Aureobasidium pullulans]